MRAALIQAYASAPVVGSRPAAEGSTVVAVTVAPVVPLDLLCASGTSYFGEPALPYVPGVQGVGRVVRSPSLEAGTRVWFATSAGMAPGDGSLAETCAVAADDVVPLDGAVADEDAAAIGTSGIAAWMCLTWRAGLQPGERVLVLGAGGTVGQAAVAAARSLGAARVVAVCRSAAAETRAARAGADEVVRVAEDDTADPAALGRRFVAAAGGSVDVVVDPVFGPLGESPRASPWPRAAGWSTSAASAATARSCRRRCCGPARRACSGTPTTRSPRPSGRSALGEVLALAASGSLVVDRRVHPLDDVATAWAAAARNDGVRPLVRIA